MSVTIAELNSRVYADLPLSEEYADVIDVHRSVVQKLNVRTSFSRSGSDINVLLSTTAEFTPTTRDYDITALIGKGIPAWLECKYNDLGVSDTFLQVRIVNLSELGDYRTAGIFAAAFWAEESTVVGTPATQYVSFTDIPNSPCRIRYDKDGVRQTLADISALPDHVSDLVVKEAENVLIPRIKVKLAMDMRRNGDLQKSAGIILQTLDGVYQQNMMDIEPLKKLWEIWAFRARNAQTNFNKPTPSSRGLYADYPDENSYY